MRKIKISLLKISFWIIVIGICFYYFSQKLASEKEEQDNFASFKKNSEEVYQFSEKTNDEQEETGIEKDNKSEEQNNLEELGEKETALPVQINNSAPFLPQAPFANWDDLHNEACEEAALIIAHYYSLGIEKIHKEKGEEEILKMVKYQEAKYGTHTDLNAQEIVKLAEDFYGDHHQIIKKYSLEKLKGYLAEGSIIIAPVAGRVLNNPYFRQPGPLYHALVITGYNEEKQYFITNDPGTRRGENFQYSYENLLDSIHDFPGEKDKILEGEKTIIKVQKEKTTF
jgi:hypothetical protein